MMYSKQWDKLVCKRAKRAQPYAAGGLGGAVSPPKKILKVLLSQSVCGVILNWFVVAGEYCFY